MRNELITSLYKIVEEENILPLTSVCNLKCIFCSHKNNPDEVEIIRIPSLDLELIKDLITYLDKNKKIVIGESTSRIIEGEPLCHPDFKETIKLLRDKFKKTRLIITTNGIRLDEDMISFLKENEPVELNFSINIIDIKSRLKFLNDKSYVNVTETLRLLKKYDLNYNGSIVGMFKFYPEESFIDLIRELTENKARTIRIFIPGFTSLSPENLRFTDQELKRFINFIHTFADNPVPVTLEPLLLKNLHGEISSVIPDSQAAEWDLKRGDIIKSVNSENIISRVHAYNLLKSKGEKQIIYERDGITNEINVKLDEDFSGLVFEFDIHPSVLTRLTQFKTSKKEKILLLTSTLAYEILKEYLEDEDFIVKRVKNNFFGGNIHCAGLLTCRDIITAVKEVIDSGYIPELLLLPPVMFDKTGRDITGQGIWEIEETTEIKTLIP